MPSERTGRDPDRKETESKAEERHGWTVPVPLVVALVAGAFAAARLHWVVSGAAVSSGEPAALPARRKQVRAPGSPKAFALIALEDVPLFESPQSYTGIGTIGRGQIVDIAGPSMVYDGYEMVPIKPRGAVQRDMMREHVPDAPSSAAGAGQIVPASAEEYESLSVEGVRVLDPPAPPGRTFCNPATSDPAIARLCGWLEDECAAEGIRRVFIADFDHGGSPVRGAGVAEDVVAGTPVFCVAPQCFVNDDTISNEMPEDTEPTCTGYDRIALWLSTEELKGNESFYAPYISLLPPEEVYRRFHPAYLETDQLRLDDSIDFWSSWLESLRACHGGRQSPSYRAMKLNYVRLLTRQYEGAGMTPLLDMPNTAPYADLTVSQEFNEEGKFCLVATRNLAAGEELLVNYGAEHHSPLLMFLLYGFALPPGHHNTTVPSEEERANAEYQLAPGDDCAGLRPSQFSLPTGAGSVVKNFYRFSRRYCAL